MRPPRLSYKDASERHMNSRRLGRRTSSGSGGSSAPESANQNVQIFAAIKGAFDLFHPFPADAYETKCLL